jgi:hypothetical protein
MDGRCGEELSREHAFPHPTRDSASLSRLPPRFSSSYSSTPLCIGVRILSLGIFEMIKTRAILLMGASLLFSSPSVCLAAGSDFVVIQGNTEKVLHDGASFNKMLVSFTLPWNVSKSGAAILELETRDVDSKFDEVYINPPLTVCASDGGSDFNQNGSIGYLDAHLQLDSSHVFADRIIFGAAKLKAGSNIFLLCSRSQTGVGGGSAVNLDSFAVKNVLIHFRTN